MKKLFLGIAMLSLAASTAFAAGFGIGYMESGDLKGPAVMFKASPFFSVEAGFQVANASISTPAFTLQHKEWTDPAAEPTAWTDVPITFPDKLVVSATGGSIGLRGLFTVMKPNPVSSLYVGAGANFLLVALKLDYDNGTSTVVATVNTWGIQGVVLGGVEIKIPAIPNLSLRGEVSYSLGYLGAATGNVNVFETASTDHTKVLFRLTPNGLWGATHAGVGVVWHL